MMETMMETMMERNMMERNDTIKHEH